MSIKSHPILIACNPLHSCCVEGETVSNIKTSIKSIKSIPTELIGRWRLLSTPPQELYIRIGVNSEYLVSGADLPFNVSADGLTLTWANATWSRYCGTGQDIKGIWRTGIGPDLEEIYFRDDQSTWYSDINTVLVGIYSITTGNHADGTMIYEERRGTVAAVANQLTVTTVFGGQYQMLFELTNGNNTLTLESAPGNIFVYERI
jgi:hypothetical protein